MKDLPLLSIILPNYNYACYLPQRIESILNQSYTHFELLILDDASTDNSKEIIQQYQQQDKRITTIFNETNSGNPFVQWQKGIESAVGEYIWIAEADDWCELNLIEKLLTLFKSDEIMVSFCQSNRANSDNQVLGLWEYGHKEYKNIFNANKVFFGKDLIEKALINENILPNASAVIFRKSAYRNVGGLNTQLKTNADWLLWLKLATKGNFAYTNRALNYFRRHEKSVIAKINDKNTVYIEKYDKTMRLSYHEFLNRNFKKKFNSVKHINKQYVNFDRGNEALYYLDKKKYFKAIKELFHATIELKSLGYIKKAVKKCLA